MMDIFILTSRRDGLASSCIPMLAQSANVRVKAVILVGPQKKVSLFQHAKNKSKKIRKIGVLGALNGLRMRKWYAYDETQDVLSVASKYDIEVLVVDSINGNDTVEKIKGLNAEIGISLSNGYIKRKVFSIPPLGMINIHTEILPDYPNAQSIIWPIFDGKDSTGVSIHRINSKIDQGNILHVRKTKINFQPKLENTVRENMKKIRESIPADLLLVIEDVQRFIEKGATQTKSIPRTTPTIWEYFQMVRKNRRGYNVKKNDL